MEEILQFVLELSYAGTWVIAAVIALRCLLYRLPKKFSYILWAIPGIRLLFPISFSGIWGFLEKAEGTESRIMVPQAVKIVHNMVKTGEQGIHADKLTFIETHTTSFFPSLWDIAGAIWIAGMAFLAGYEVYCFFRLKKQLCISVKWKENIYFADGIIMPFVLAGFPDKIYLPSGLKKEECSYILLHEKIHVKRKDSLFKLLAFLVLCIHWFNPAVWLGMYLFTRDMEMSCDEAAVAGLGQVGKKGYAEDLLRFAAGRGKQFQCLVKFGEKGVKKRIMNLYQKKTKTKCALVLGSVLVIAAAAVLLPDFLGQNPKKVSGEAHIEANSEKKLEGLAEKEKTEEAGREYGYPVGLYKYGEDGKVSGEYKILHTKSEIDGIPARLIWLKGQVSKDGNEKEFLTRLARTACKDFKKEYPECEIKGISYHFQISESVAHLSSANGKKEVFQFDVRLPKGWEDTEKFSGMDSRRQTAEWMLVQNGQGEWETLNWGFSGFNLQDVRHNESCITPYENISSCP